MGASDVFRRSARPPRDSRNGVPMKSPLDSLAATIAIGVALTAILYAIARTLPT